MTMKKIIKILFIDDEQDACGLFKKIVGKKGFKVFTATTAERGFSLYKKELPNLVFLDLVMPDTDGITLLKKIRKINPKQIVIILTGFGDIRSARSAMRFGAYDYVSKPFDINAIIGSIKDALSVNA